MDKIEESSSDVSADKEGADLKYGANSKSVPVPVKQIRDGSNSQSVQPPQPSSEE